MPAFGALWAAYNTYRMRKAAKTANDKKRWDKGVATLGFVVFLTALGYLNPAILFVLKWGQVAACFLVALNFGMGLKLGIARKMVKSKIKSPLWAKIFNTYCISFAVFWIIAAGTIAMRGS